MKMIVEEVTVLFNAAQMGKNFSNMFSKNRNPKILASLLLLEDNTESACFKQT